MSGFIAAFIARAIVSFVTAVTGSKLHGNRRSWCHLASKRACIFHVALLGFLWVVSGRILGWHERGYRGMHRQRDGELRGSRYGLQISWQSMVVVPFGVQLRMHLSACTLYMSQDLGPLPLTRISHGRVLGGTATVRAAV